MNDDDEILQEYDWEWVQQIAGGDGIGNYPASREALKWCVAEIRRLRASEGSSE